MLSSSKIESSTRVFEVRLIRPLDERLFLDFDLRAEAARDVKSLVVLSWDLLVGVALTSFIGDDGMGEMGKLRGAFNRSSIPDSSAFAFFAS